MAAEGTSAAIEALEAWASSGDMPSPAAPVLWTPVLQFLIEQENTRPVGLDAFVIPLA